MSLARAMAIGAGGLEAQRTRMELVASNLANVGTTRTSEGGLYRRRTPVFVAQPIAAERSDPLGQALYAVRVERIAEDPSAPLMRYEPGHPHANADGEVAYPNVDPVREMVDMLSATRSYEAQVTLVRSVREMMSGALQIIA
ncbi:MAG: flagellar basal body rod protein FlgC [bacterium]|nr:flagellar basal body rod protein FlgC [bacterium]